MSSLSLSKTAFSAVDPLAVFAAAKSHEFRCLWSQPDQNFTLVGVGSAVAWEAGSTPGLAAPVSADCGVARFLQAKQFMAELDFEGPAPIALGGFAFASGSGAPNYDQQIWGGFPSAKLVIPEQLFILHHAEAPTGGARLLAPVEHVEVLTAQTRPSASGRDRALAQAQALHSQAVKAQAIHAQATQAQGSHAQAAPAQGSHTQAAKTQGSHTQTAPAQAQTMPAQQAFNAQATGSYLDYLAAAISAVEQNQLQKVVAARVISQQCQAPPENVLGRLAQTAGVNAVFAFGNSSHTFMGATPELLLRQNQAKVTSLALAGSERPSQAGSLMRDPKELAEHQMVVKHIRQRLVEAGVAVDPLAAPRPLDLKTIVHLATPISGTCQDQTALDLIARLHPAPSVGGLPTSEALRFIAQHEKLDRGWYAGPVGWVTPDGDGTFFVALRSLLLDWPNRLSYCFAGSGIVQGSSLEKEDQETLLKLQTALLSIEPTPIDS